VRITVQRLRPMFSYIAIQYGQTNTITTVPTTFGMLNHLQATGCLLQVYVGICGCEQSNEVEMCLT
jgi:hypothetical protein